MKEDCDESNNINGYEKSENYNPEKTKRLADCYSKIINIIVEDDSREGLS